MMARKQKTDPAADFAKAFGEPTPYRDFTPADKSRLGARLPSVLQAILSKDGWASYKDQAFWLCDPDDWREAAAAWFPDTPGAEVFGRSAFGDLLVWDGAMFWYARVHEAVVIMLVDDADWLFSRTLCDQDFSLHDSLPADVKRARDAVGRLAWNEMYALTPALALGGDPTTSKIDRVLAKEHLAMLAGLGPIKRM
jgi:hypothetical protein